MNDYERLVSAIRAQGERLTIQRQHVITALTETRSHMTVNDIYQYIEHVDGAVTIAEPTIYRILQWLKDLHLVSQTDMAESGIVYQIIGQAPHHHLICLNCGRTIDFEDSAFDGLRAHLLAEHGFQARIDHMAVYGYCSDCADNAGNTNG